MLRMANAAAASPRNPRRLVADGQVGAPQLGISIRPLFSGRGVWSKTDYFAVRMIGKAKVQAAQYLHPRHALGLVQSLRMNNAWSAV
jgi:hypothetical protein